MKELPSVWAVEHPITGNVQLDVVYPDGTYEYFSEKRQKWVKSPHKWSDGVLPEEYQEKLADLEERVLH
jgi:hypothetical protein